MDTIKRARMGQAAILTALTVALALAVGLTLGATALLLTLLPLPLPLAVLWLSADVVRADEREPVRARARPDVVPARRVPATA